MIQDISPKRLYNQYDPTLTPQPEDFVLYFEGAKLAVLEEAPEMLRFPTVREMQGAPVYTYLFSVDRQRFFRSESPEQLPEGWRFTDVFALRNQGGMEKAYIYAALTGKHLADWYQDTKFCGRCGGKTAHSKTERAMVCQDCGKTFYPRIMPAVIVGVINGDRLLLTRYRTGYGHNALIAGFTEIGETAEETVAREVMEEAGVRVKNIRYYKSQPWGVANDLLMGFYCEVDGDPEIHMDTEELKYAQWVPRQEIQLQPDDFSLTNEMMHQFKLGNIVASE